MRKLKPNLKAEIEHIVRQVSRENSPAVVQGDVVRPVGLIAVFEGIGLSFGVPFAGTLVGLAVEAIYRNMYPSDSR